MEYGHLPIEGNQCYNCMHNLGEIDGKIWCEFCDHICRPIDINSIF